jgi:hypothetical protein
MLDEVKLLLGITDGLRDDLLSLIINLTESRLVFLIGSGDGVPHELSYIVTEVACARYNRLGSEATTSHSVEGESLSFKDDDFDAYKSDIAAYVKASAEPETTDTGGVLFF